MHRNKLAIILWTLVCLNFCSNNFSFAVGNIGINENRYPDYSYEFCGKDKCETFNRKLFVFNLKLNKYVLRPVNIVWASMVPKYGMDRLQNFYSNINFPERFVSCLLERDFKASKQEIKRFAINMTVGCAGFYDPAKSKFKIEARQEDMQQALAMNKHIKQGPYLVLPVVRGNIRDLVGQLLNCPLRPFSYIPIAGGIATAVFNINNSTYMQPMFKKVDDSYPDPYPIVREVDGITQYTKVANLDRTDVYLSKIAQQNLVKISTVSSTINVKPDINLSNFNSQDSLTDSIRTTFFDNQKIGSSIWSEMSVWNRTFGKKIKIASVKVVENRPNYRFRYILQKNQFSPLAVIYPSIGDGILSDKSTVLAKILYDEGYSVIIQGSSFNWEFIKSMPADYRPGLPYQDAKFLRLTSAKIIDSLEKNKKLKFKRKILVGCSFGALTGMFAAAQEEQDNTLGISEYISINPPVDIFFALNQLDKYCLDWKKDSSDIKMKTAITAEKVVRVYNNIQNKTPDQMAESLPFTEDESELLIGFLMKQKLADVVFEIEHCSRGKKNNIYEITNKMSYDDYAQKYLSVNQSNPSDETKYKASLYSLVDFLKTGSNYKIYHSVDDYFVNSEQLQWLKQQTGDKSVFFSNGSHLGFMYRPEFIEQFKKDTTLQKEL